MPTPRPVLAALCAACAVAAFAQGQKPASPTKSVHIGQFTFSNPGGSLTYNTKNRKRTIVEVSGRNPTHFRSEGLDVDARHIYLVNEGRIVRDGFVEGAVKLVLRSPGQTDTLFCEKATLKIEADGVTQRLELTGGVRWLHTGPEVEGPLEMKGSRAVVTRGKGDDGPEIEIFDIDANGTPREPAPKPKGKS